MKTNTIIIIVSVLILAGIIFLVGSSIKRSKIEKAAVSSGVPAPIATAIANSSNPAQAARMIGIPSDISNSIANGISVQ